MNFLFRLLSLIPTLLFILSSSIGVGLFIWKRLFGKEKYPNVAVIFFLGEVFISLTTIISSLVFSYPKNLILLVVLLSPFFISGIFFFLRTPPKYRFPKNFLSRVLLLILVILLAINFLRALLPPIAWDEVVYHEPVVREIAQGKVEFPVLKDSPFNNFYEPFSLFYGSFPYASEAFASLGYLLSFGYPSIASILYLVNFLMFLVFIRWALHNLFGVKGVAWLSIGIALIVSGNLIPVLSTSYIDLNVAFYQFMALILLLIANKKKSYYLIVPSVIFASYSLGQKFTAFYFLPFYGILFLVEGLRNKYLKKYSPFIIKGILLGVLAGGFWYFKNLFLYGNPIYPLVFGHKGFSENAYKLIIQTQLNPHFPRTAEVLWQQIRENYLSETGLIFAGGVILFAGIFSKKKLNIYSIYLLIFTVYLFLFNFYIGNQLMRYILVAPVVVYFVFGQFLDKYKFLSILIAPIAILGLIGSSLWPFWKNKLSDLSYLNSSNYEGFYRKNIGCLVDVAALVQKNTAKAINLWDPYAAVFYDDEEIFYYPSVYGKKFVLPKEVEYLYINTAYKEQFLAKRDQNANMLDIDGRMELEGTLLNPRKVLFKEGACVVYSIK